MRAGAAWEKQGRAVRSQAQPSSLTIAPSPVSEPGNFAVDPSKWLATWPDKSYTCFLRNIFLIIFANGRSSLYIRSFLLKTLAIVQSLRLQESCPKRYQRLF